MPNLLQRTVLQVCHAAADNIGFARPATLSDNVNLNDRRFLQAIQWAMRDIAAPCPHPLIREYTFYTRSSVEAYPMPGDFGGFLPNTHWNRTNSWPNRLLGAASWQVEKSGIADTAVMQRYRMKGYNDQLGRFFIDPVPSTAEQEVFEYQSNGHFFEGAPTTAKDRHLYITAAASGSEIQVAQASTSISIPSVFLVTANLGSGGKNMEGRIFTVSSATTSSGRHKCWLQGTDGRNFEASGSLEYREVMAYLNVAVNALGASAIPMVDSDLVEAGMIYRLRKMVGQPYAAEQMRFEELLDTYVGKKKGASIVSLSGHRSGFYNVPDGNWPTG